MFVTELSPPPDPLNLASIHSSISASFDTVTTRMTDASVASSRIFSADSPFNVGAILIVRDIRGICIRTIITDFP